MGRMTLAPLPIIVAGTLLAGCSASTTSTSPTPSSAPTSASTASAPATLQASASPNTTAVPTSTDPCQLVTASEASSLTGVSYGAGVEQTTSGGDKLCVYGYQTTDVFIAQIAIASSASVAQAGWAQEEAKAQQSLSQLGARGSNVGAQLSDQTISGYEKAATALLSGSISGVTLNGSAIYLLKGADFFTFSDISVNHSVPGSAAMIAEAQTALSRLP